MPKVWKLVRYLVGGLFGLVLLLACVGFTYEQLGESRDRRLNHPPGQLIDVGGYSMHLYCTGQGSPTVVLESGVSGYWLDWYKVQPQISQLTRVCSYDRAGSGWSSPSPQNRTSKIFAQELHTLLQRASVPAPYVLVGHSMGGLHVRMFAAMYPAEVAGMILVDAVYPHPEQAKQWTATFIHAIDMHGITIPIGISRLMGWCGTLLPGHPELQSLAPMVRTVECQWHYFRQVHDEWAGFGEDADQVRAAAPLGNMPLVVLSHDPDKATPDLKELWESMHQELARLSTNRSRVIAKGSGHYIQFDRPDVVIEAVQKVVGQCRAAHQPATQL
jgi:pimeloyl-ACP methyl ester carboxylesterase